MNTRIAELAELAGVSVSTVSRALNDKPEVNNQTKERIFELAQNINYEPNVMAKAARTKLTNTIGLIVTDILNPYFAELIEVIEEQASILNYHVLLCVAGNKVQKEAEYVRLLRGERVDGMLIVHPGGKASLAQIDYISELKRRDLPFVILGELEQMQEIDYITYNDEIGAYKLFSHLISLGHRKIGFIHADPACTSSQKRISGYRKAFAENGIPIIEELLMESDTRLESGRQSARKILNSKHNPSAIVALNDFLAFAVLQVVREHRLNVPKDIAVAGFDNIELVSSLDVPLTTVDFPVDVMAEKAMNLIFDKIHNKTKKEISQIILEPKLIIRDSSGGQIRKGSSFN